MKDLPTYVCHKQVHAFKIGSITHFKLGAELGSDCGLVDEGGLRVEANQEFMKKHQPKVGDYFVKYKDGYASISPAKAFEEGYTAVDEMGIRAVEIAQEQMDQLRDIMGEIYTNGVRAGRALESEAFEAEAEEEKTCDEAIAVNVHAAECLLLDLIELVGVQDGPNVTTYIEPVLECIVGIGNDHTASIRIHQDDLDVLKEVARGR